MRNLIEKRKILFVVVMICVMVMGMSGCEKNASGGKGSGEADEINSKLSGEKFPAFTAKDFEGNTYSSEDLKNNPVTIVNFWFTGCHACVEEMAELQTLSEEFAKKDVKLLGGCLDGDTQKDVAMKILKEKKASFPNLVFDSSKEMDEYLGKILAFPTTVIIDREGNLVGQPIQGAIVDKERVAKINKVIDELIAKEK